MRPAPAVRSAGLLAAWLLAWAAAAQAAGTVAVTGSVKFAKTVYTHPPASLAQHDQDTAAAGVTVKALETSSLRELASATTDASGAFSMSVTFSVAYSLKVYASGGGAEVRREGAAAAYEHQFASGASTAGSHDVVISKANNAGAWNIHAQLARGRGWLTDRGRGLSADTMAYWPAASGTQFDVDSKVLHIQGFSWDPDEWDDDIILHEFGHLVVDAISVDHSAGGSHSISESVDLRLSWSEGAAHFFSSAVRGNAWQVDGKGSVDNAGRTDRSQFQIDTPGALYTGAENEVAVACVLWQTFQAGGDVLGALVRFRSLPAAIAADPVSMDTFDTLWSGSSLSAWYTDRQMSYYPDALSGNSQSAPHVIADPSSFSLGSLSFYPDGNQDWFRFRGAAGESYLVETVDARNGALTSLQVYFEDTSRLLASNVQRNGLSTDTTSSANVRLTETGNLLVQVQRFSNASTCYTVRAADVPRYGSTVGRHGSYGLKVTRSSPGGSSAAPAASSPAASSSTATTTAGTSAPATNGTVTTAGGGGGGGGCLLIRP